jgi:phosphohistidine phosphatase
LSMQPPCPCRGRRRFARGAVEAMQGAMERLILLRHGEAERSAASGDDFDRALNGQGRLESAAMGRLLAVAGAAPDLALVSSAVRAVQTFEAARAAFPDAVEQSSRALYLASPRKMMAAIRAAGPAARTLMVVGHNPGIQELAEMLAREGGAADATLERLERGFPTAAAAVFDMAEDGSPTLKALHLPKGERL